VRHTEPHHHQPRRGYEHDVLPWVPRAMKESGGMPSAMRLAAPPVVPRLVQKPAP
jgi:hypothetical protein